MKRYHQEVALMRKRQRLLQVHRISEDECPKGRFRKRHPLDCGKPRCQLCHGEKVLGRRSHKARRADEASAEQLAQLKRSSK